MLELKNIIEDLVEELIGQMDEVKDGKLHENQKIELASYVLNRVKPMYITSSKGFAHIIKKYQNDPQFLADLMVMLNEGCKVIQKTKLSGPPSHELKKGTAYFFLPRIYGKVISSRTMLFVDEAKLTLYIDSEIAATHYSAWTNPLQLQPDADGIFSFAPMPISAAKTDETRTFQFKIVIQKEHHHYEKYISYQAISVVYNGLESEVIENALQTEDIYVPF